MSEHTTEEVIKSLEQLYTQAEFSKAQKLIIENRDHFDIGLFHYNLGTILLKKEEWAGSRFHFEKALKAGFVNPMVLNNLKVGLNKLNVATIEKTDNALDKFTELGLSLSKQIPTLFILLIIFIFLGLIQFKIVKLSKRIVYIFLGLVLSLSLSCVIFLKGKYLAITLDKVEVKEGPSQIFNKIYEIPAGAKIVVEGPQNGWYFVTSPKHLVGWVLNKDLGII